MNDKELVYNYLKSTKANRTKLFEALDLLAEKEMQGDLNVYVINNLGMISTALMYLTQGRQPIERIMDVIELGGDINAIN